MKDMRKYDSNNYKMGGLMPSCLDGIKALDSGATLGKQFSEIRR